MWKVGDVLGRGPVQLWLLSAVFWIWSSLKGQKQKKKNKTTKTSNCLARTMNFAAMLNCKCFTKYWVPSSFYLFQVKCSMLQFGPRWLLMKLLKSARAGMLSLRLLVSSMQRGASAWTGATMGGSPMAVHGTLWQYPGCNVAEDC